MKPLTLSKIKEIERVMVNSRGRWLLAHPELVIGCMDENVSIYPEEILELCHAWRKIN